MNCSFIHALWGVYSNKNKLWGRLSKCDNDIKLFKLNPYSPKTVVYIYGEDNFKRMTDLGFDCRLLDKKPYIWDMETEQYRHKMEAWRAGSQEFDAITFLDWDTISFRPIPDDYWTVMNEGESIKTPIYQYHKKRVNRPPNDFRKVSTASFLYIRGKEHMDAMIKVWEDMGKPLKEEYALTLYIDNMSGGWKGLDNYRKYDPIYYTMTPELYADKDRSKLIFGHHNFKVVNTLIGNGLNVKERIDKFAPILLR